METSSNAVITKDPVCGMTVDPAGARHRHRHANKEYLFCCAGCAEKFKANPEKYLQGTPPASSGLVTLGGPAKPAVATETDPVCGMKVNPATAKHKTVHAGKTVYFCCAGCAEKFNANPGRYQAGAAVMPAPVRAPSASVPYVCPMCPEVKKAGPGPCPSCGMALEPEVYTPATRTEYTCPMHPEIVRPGP